jgi:hypothetical protein
MIKWDSRTPPYRVRIPDYMQVPAAYGRVGLVVGEHRGIGDSGPVVAVVLDGAASSTVAAVKADCTVLDGKQNGERSPVVSESNAADAPLTPFLALCLEWRGLARP